MFIIKSSDGYWNNDEGWVEEKEDATTFESKDYDLPIGQYVEWEEVKEGETVKVELINYFDVWGNPEDGFEINNMCSEGTLELPEDFKNKDLLEALIEFGFLVYTCTEEMIHFEDLFDFGVELYQADTMCPLGRVEFKRN